RGGGRLVSGARTKNERIPGKVPGRRTSGNAQQGPEKEQDEPGNEAASYLCHGRASCAARATRSKFLPNARTPKPNQARAWHDGGMAKGQSPEDFLRMAIDEAVRHTSEGHGGPFGAVVVENGTLVAVGWNAVTSANDPTAHAEIQAIREACKKLGRFQL